MSKLFGIGERGSTPKLFGGGRGGRQNYWWGGRGRGEHTKIICGRGDQGCPPPRARQKPNQNYMGEAKGEYAKIIGGEGRGEHVEIIWCRGGGAHQNYWW